MREPWSKELITNVELARSLWVIMFAKTPTDELLKEPARTVRRPMLYHVAINMRINRIAWKKDMKRE
jgi:hypothetical protein